MKCPTLVDILSVMTLGGQEIGEKLREARAVTGLSRERVVRDPRLDPPMTSKTLERWEKNYHRAPKWRLEQLAAVYGVSVESLSNGRDQ